MLKVPAKSKPPPWIPPGKNALRGRKTEKPKVRNKSRSINDTSIKDPEFSTDVKEDPKEDEPVDDMSVSSSSSLSQYRPNEPNIHVISIYQDMKLLYVHFSSLRTSYIVAFRLMDLQSIEDATVKEMLNDIGVNVKESNTLFDDLEFAVTVLENTLEDGLKTQEYLNVFKCKDRLLSKILDMYERVILVYQFVFEKLDFQEMSSLLDSVTRKLKASEKKNISQEATIKDLERRISIHESKTSSFDSYKANLENAKADLEKQLAHKEVQIKYLNDELVSVSGKKVKSDHEELIQIIEQIKSKAQSEKKILKKALKFQKAQLKENEVKFQKLTEESKEKEKMLFDIASQRDQLKVQLTVANNSVIQLKNQMEEMKIQNSKVQKEMDEQKLSKEKEMSNLQNLLKEKNFIIEKSDISKKSLEDTIKELQIELDASKKQVINLKAEKREIYSSELAKFSDSDEIYKEIQQLAPLLQSTKDAVERLHECSFIASSCVEHSVDNTEWMNAQIELLEKVKETNEHLLELKDMYKGLVSDPKGTQNISKRNDMEKQFKKLEYLYASSMKENQALKAEIEDTKNASNSTVQKTENYFTANIPRDTSTRKYELEIFKKNEEMIKMKYEYQQKENDLESQLREYKEKVKILEVDHHKMSDLEEELKTTKAELTLVREKKEEETSRLLQRTKELQESLDSNIAEKKLLDRYIEVLKTSFSNVFGGS